jgi:hypothetical protein
MALCLDPKLEKFLAGYRKYANVVDGNGGGNSPEEQNHYRSEFDLLEAKATWLVLQGADRFPLQ